MPNKKTTSRTTTTKQTDDLSTLDFDDAEIIDTPEPTEDELHPSRSFEVWFPIEHRHQETYQFERKYPDFAPYFRRFLEYPGARNASVLLLKVANQDNIQMRLAQAAVRAFDTGVEFGEEAAKALWSFAQDVGIKLEEGWWDDFLTKVGNVHKGLDERQKDIERRIKAGFQGMTVGMPTRKGGNAK